jgi:hypothetical protein
MERDVLLSYGLSQFSKESVMERSDKYTWSVCKSSGRASLYNPSQELYECMSSKSSDIAVIQTPYAFKLLVQEMETMGITPRLITENVDYEWNEEEFFDEEEQSGGQTYTEMDVIEEEGEPTEQQPSDEEAVKLEAIETGDENVEVNEGDENVEVNEAYKNADDDNDEDEDEEEGEEEEEDEEDQYPAAGGDKKNEEDQDDNIIIDDVSINDENEEVDITDNCEQSSDIKIIDLDM